MLEYKKKDNHCLKENKLNSGKLVQNKKVFIRKASFK